jgi:site-specific recombinase XerD
MVQVTRNLKHKAIIALLYSSGVRREEFLNLKVTDIDSDRMLVRVRNGKGNKSRDTLLSKNALNMLREYYRYHRTKEYLFESYIPGKAYSASSVFKVIRKAAQRAGITKRVCIHSLRHAFATHLLEQGANLKVIQKLLGHTSLRSTAIYLHLAKVDYTDVESPFDHLEIQQP